MIQHLASNTRGFANHGWLQSYHSFSFANYYNPTAMGWGNLRVINEDRIAAGEGFGTHGHRDMEIISYVLSGALAHKDSIGNIESIPAGDVQGMSAGSGVTHSEFNHSQTETTHFLQIWIEPNVRGIAPSYGQQAVSAADKDGALCLLAAPNGAGGKLTIHADAKLYAGCFSGAQTASLNLAAGRKAYVHLIRGALTVNGIALKSGDALKMQDETMIEISQGQAAEVLVFDLAN